MCTIFPRFCLAILTDDTLSNPSQITFCMIDLGFLMNLAKCAEILKLKSLVASCACRITLNILTFSKECTVMAHDRNPYESGFPLMGAGVLIVAELVAGRWQTEIETTDSKVLRVRQ